MGFQVVKEGVEGTSGGHGIRLRVAATLIPTTMSIRGRHCFILGEFTKFAAVGLGRELWEVTWAARGMPMGNPRGRIATLIPTLIGMAALIRITLVAASFRCLPPSAAVAVPWSTSTKWLLLTVIALAVALILIPTTMATLIPTIIATLIPTEGKTRQRT